MILQLLLFTQVLIPLLQVLNVQVLLSLYLMVLPLVLLLGLTQLLLHFPLVLTQLDVQSLLLAAPLLHFLLAHQHYIG